MNESDKSDIPAVPPEAHIKPPEMFCFPLFVPTANLGRQACRSKDCIFC